MGVVAFVNSNVFGIERMKTLVVMLALLVSFPAAATVELLPGSSPQTAAVGFHYEPIRVRVTDAAGAPVAGVRVGFTLQWTFGSGTALAPASGEGPYCGYDMSWFCTATTDALGEATFRRLYATRTGTHEVHLAAESGLGSAVATFVAHQASSLPRIVAFDGPGRPLPLLGYARFTARVLDVGGRPVEGVPVTFRAEGARLAPSPGWFAPYTAVVSTDAQGHARSPAFGAGDVEGSGVVLATTRFPGTEIDGTARFEYTIARDAAVTQVDYQDMWWAGLEESGWGMSLAQDGTELFPVVFTYDELGQPTWYVLINPANGGNAGWTFYRFMSSVFSPRSAPFHAYDASRFRLGATVAIAELTFDDPGALALGVQFAGRPPPSNTVRKRLIRQDFTGDNHAPLGGLSGMWWGGLSQNGWGISIMQQPGGLFVVWMTYGDDGKPTWFVMPSGAWTGMSYGGAIYRVSGPRWSDFDARQVKLETVGSFRLEFQDRASATFHWSVGPHRGIEHIERQPL